MSTKNHALAALLLLMTVVVYLPVWSARFIWDDDDYVEKNSTLRTTDGLRRIWLEPGSTPQYYPLVFTSFWLEYQTWELAPGGYHVVNVLLHGINAILLWLMLKRLAIPGAWFAAAIFTVHPVYVESVAWITERKNVLSGFFYLAAMLAYFGSSPNTESQRTKGYIWSVILFLCALLSKTVTCSLPAAIALILWWKQGRVTRRDWLRLAPMFALGIAFAGITVYMEKTHVGAEGKDWELSALDRILIAGRALWFYAGKLVWPVNLTFMYPRWTMDSTDWRLFLFPLSAVTVIVGLWMGRHRLGRGPLVAVLFFAGTLVPALGFFDVYPMRYSFVADHFQYLASIGLIVLVTGVVSQVSQNLALGVERVAVATGVGAIVVLGALTLQQTRVYHDLDTLWTDTIRKNPQCWMAHFNFGRLYLDRRQYTDAERHLAEAVAIKPDMADGHSELGRLCSAQGRIEDATRHFATALAINPRHEVTILNTAVLLANQEKYNEAVLRFHDVLEINPRNAKASYFLGLAHARLGNISEAIYHLGMALQHDPRLADAHQELGEIHLAQGNAAEAVPALRQAVKLRPLDSKCRSLLAQALQQIGQYDEAAMHFREAQHLASMGR